MLIKNKRNPRTLPWYTPNLTDYLNIIWRKKSQKEVKKIKQAWYFRSQVYKVRN